ncbi:MAG TPA: hypothetical protein VI168_03325 [Croceibacterium sp.]
MTRKSSSIMALALLACAQAPASEVATTPPSAGDPLADAAALLAAGEAADGSTERAPLVARLDALRVAAAEGETDDPLAAWRAEAAAADSAAPVYRGRTLGPAYRRARIAPGARMQIEQIFYAGERAEIAAHSQGGQPIALEIRNPRTGKVCIAELSPKASCNWLPLFTERFSIELVNQSRDQASVYIVFR